jgi:hypothetical protein
MGHTPELSRRFLDFYTEHGQITRRMLESRESNRKSATD